MNDDVMQRSATGSAVGRSEIDTLMESVLYEVKRIVVGQDHFLERVLVAMLAR